jgi:hypothetical protein
MPNFETYMYNKLETKINQIKILKLLPKASNLSLQQQETKEINQIKVSNCHK